MSDNAKMIRFIDSDYKELFQIPDGENPAPELWQAQPAFGVVQAGAADESHLFYRNEEPGNLCIGYLRGDYGNQGTSFYHQWFEQDNGRKTPEFRAEFQTVMDTLRKDVLKDYKSSQDYCRKHPEAKAPGRGEGKHFGFKLETDTRQYFIRCTTLRDDYFYVFAYDKAAAPEKDRAAGEKASVLGKIRGAQSAPKPPVKPKASGKNKGEPEL